MSKMELVGHITLHRVSLMTPLGRKTIAKWLRKTAKDLVALGDQYTDNVFHARYWARKR